MMAKKRKGFVLPVQPAALLEAIGLTEEQSASQIEVAIFADASLDPALLAYAKAAFRPRTDNLILTVTPYFDEPPLISEDNALLVVLAADGPATGRIMVDALRVQVSAVAVTLDPARLQQIAREHYNELDLRSIVTVEEYEGRADGERGGETDNERFARLFVALGGWIVRKLSDDQLALARAFDFVRNPFVANAIQATSVQNAVIAAAFFLPGADMPLLTLNQAKLFLQIAAAYGAVIDQQRLKELVVLLLSGFGFRALARRLVGVVPVLGWAIRGGVGYTGTLAVGQAAREYFERGGDIKTILESLRSRGADEKSETGERRDSEIQVYS
jgi:uncharacterized protein (DUF697 family)